MSAVRRELTPNQWLEAVGIDPFWIVDESQMLQAATTENASLNIAGPAEVEILDQIIRSCKKCGLARGRKQAVPGTGDLKADWLLVGEAPGVEEDQSGLPFVGQSGQLLEAMLAALGLNREKGVFLTNAVKCRPEDNRTPETTEMDSCNTFLSQQIAQIQPKVILALGRPAAYAVLGQEAPIQSMRGRVHYHQQGNRKTPVVVTYHPAYLLREPTEKWKAWQDLLLAKNSING